MFEFKLELIPHTFGEKRIIIDKDGSECFRVDFDTISWMKHMGIDPTKELTTMMIYELKDDTFREEIFELLTNNFRKLNNKH